MRGTPTPERGFYVAKNGFYPELRQFLGETLQSPEADQVRRYEPFVVGDHVFPLEGTLASHSTGTYRRGNRLMEREWALCTEGGVLPPAFERRRQKYLHKTHDLGELGDQGDLPHGTKSDEHRQAEAIQFQTNLELTDDPELRRTLEWVKTVSKNAQETSAGRFWKNLVEHGGFLETARRLHREYVLGESLNHDEENQRSGMYLHESLHRDEHGQIVTPELRGIRALIADILINTAGPFLRAVNEFQAARAYMKQYAAEFLSLYQTYVLDTATNQALIAEVTTLKEYTAAAAAALLEQRLQEDISPLIAALESLLAPNLERRPAAELIDLADGRERSVA